MFVAETLSPNGFIAARVRVRVVVERKEGDGNERGPSERAIPGPGPGPASAVVRLLQHFVSDCLTRRVRRAELPPLRSAGAAEATNCSLEQICVPCM